MLSSLERHLERGPSWVLVDGQLDYASELAELYRELAVLCIEQQLERVLIKVGARPYGCLALRNAFSVMLLAGLPPGFRVAFIRAPAQSSGPLEALRSDLQQLKLDARIFEDEDAALRWLGLAERREHAACP